MKSTVKKEDNSYRNFILIRCRRNTGVNSKLKVFRMRILHIAPFFYGSTSYERFIAFEKMDFSIRRYDINFYYQHWRRGVISIERRIPFSPIHFKINREIFDAAMEFMPNIIFVEKAKYLFSSTILFLSMFSILRKISNCESFAPYSPKLEHQFISYIFCMFYSNCITS